MMTWATRILFVLALCLPGALAAQSTGRITGTVIDTGSAQPIPGVNILIVGTTLGAQTGADGRYTVHGVPEGTHTVRAQRIGFAPQTRSVVVTPGQVAPASFEMRAQAAVLEAVVAVGYGTQARRDVTGSISTVTTDALERAPIASVDQVLQGTSPGVQVTTASSEPGGALSVRIRGTSSLTGSAEPLYVIDGFPIENDIEGSAVGNGGRTRTTPSNPLVTLNPSDIESISILKDASATAIYGSRGANGVVIITTKQGRGTKPVFTLDYYTGVSTVAKTYDMLDAAQYMEYANRFAANSSTPYEPFPEAVRQQILASGIDTDWQDEIFRTAGTQNLQLSVRGATSAASPTRYALSGGVFEQDGVVVGSGLRRLSGRLNLNQAMGSRVEFGATLSASQARSKAVPTGGQQNANAGAISAAIQYVPILPVKLADGRYSYINRDLNAYHTLLDAPQTPNPVSLAAEVRDSLSDTRLLGNVFAQVELLDGLEAKVSFGADYADRWRYTYYPRTTLRGEQSNGEAIRASSSTGSWLNENTLTYTRQFGGAHDLTVLGGYTRQRTDSDGETMSNSQFVSDITGYYDIGSGTQEGGPTVTSRRSTQTLASWLGRVNYSLLDRYLVTATVRADGSSRFSENHKWATFPSVAFGWRVSSEPWFESIDAISDLKLRFSWGEVGNPSIRPYQSLARLADIPYSFGGQPFAGYYPTAVGNPDLTWETTSGTDFGIDVSFLERFTLVADYYQKTTRDLLLQIELDPVLGFENALANRGSVENKGFEIGLDTRILEGTGDNGFGWRANFNIARNKNTVIDLGGPQTIEADFITTDYNLPGSRFEVGQPLGAFYGFRSNGVIRDQAQADAIHNAGYRPFNWNASSNPNARFQPGDMWIEDVDNVPVDTLADGTVIRHITLNDRTIIGDPLPDFTYGLTNTFTFRGFELTGLLQGQRGGKVLNVNRIRTESSPRVNVSRERFEGAWTPENPNATFPAIGTNPNQVGTNNFTSNLLEDASYLRLRTLTLSYAVPQSLLTRSGIGGARVYVTGTNLFTISDYSGFDPDVSSMSVGAQNRGIDIGAYPLAKGVTVGLNFTY